MDFFEISPVVGIRDMKALKMLASNFRIYGIYWSKMANWCALTKILNIHIYTTFSVITSVGNSPGYAF